MVAVASGCLQLSSLDLSYCFNITDVGVVAVASMCKQLTTLNLRHCSKITDAAVVAVTSGCCLAAHVARPDILWHHLRDSLIDTLLKDRFRDKIR